MEEGGREDDRKVKEVGNERKEGAKDGRRDGW